MIEGVEITQELAVSVVDKAIEIMDGRFYSLIALPKPNVSERLAWDLIKKILRSEKIREDILDIVVEVNRKNIEEARNYKALRDRVGKSIEDAIAKLCTEGDAK